MGPMTDEIRDRIDSDIVEARASRVRGGLDSSLATPRGRPHPEPTVGVATYSGARCDARHRLAIARHSRGPRTDPAVARRRSGVSSRQVSARQHGPGAGSCDTTDVSTT